MGLRNMSLTPDVTISFTNGTAVGFVDNGITIQNGVQIVASSDDYNVRRACTFKYRPASLDPKTQVFGKDKKSAVFVVPMVASDGKTYFNTLRIERELHPEFPVDDWVALNKIGAQLLVGTDASAFWTVGSTT